MWHFKLDLQGEIPRSNQSTISRERHLKFFITPIHFSTPKASRKPANLLIRLQIPSLYTELLYKPSPSSCFKRAKKHVSEDIRKAGRKTGRRLAAEKN